MNVLLSSAPFCYVSGLGTDNTGRSRPMCARVEGETENALPQLPLETYLFRPAFVRPRPGVRSRTRFYRAVCSAVGWMHPLVARVAPHHATTSENIGRAMLSVSRNGFRTRVLASPEINEVAGR